MAISYRQQVLVVGEGAVQRDRLLKALRDAGHGAIDGGAPLNALELLHPSDGPKAVFRCADDVGLRAADFVMAARLRGYLGPMIEIGDEAACGAEVQACLGGLS